LPKNWLITVEGGKGQNRPWVFETSIHKGVKKRGGRLVCFSFLSAFSPKNNRFENNSIFYLPLFNSVPEKSIPRYQNIGRTFVLPHAPSGYAYAYNTPISPVYHYSTLHMDVPGSSYNVEVKIQIS